MKGIPRCRAGLLLMGLMATAVGGASEPIVIKDQHPLTRAAGITNIALEQDELTLEASQAIEAFLVIKADSPVQVASATNAEARLVPGWDGSIGYSHYGMHLSIKQPGRVVVRFTIEPPRSEPLETTAQQIKDWRDKFARSSSRFPDQKEAFDRWQQEYRAKLAGWLMNGSLPERVRPETETLETTDYDRFTVRKFRYRSQSDRTNTALLALPRHKEGAQVPLLLALHGHEAKWGQADIEAFTPGHIDDFCAYFAERGWAVLQPATMDHTLQHPGWTLQGEWTWDAMVALDYALSQPEIDQRRAAVCGLSTGGHLAMNILALDERVRAGVVGGILSTWKHIRTRFCLPPGCECGIAMQLGDRLRQCDWAALAAPKPVQFHYGIQDYAFCPGAAEKLLDYKWMKGILPLEEYQTMFAEVKRAYRICDYPTAVLCHIHLAGHKIDNEAACLWLEQALARRKSDNPDGK